MNAWMVLVVIVAMVVGWLAYGYFQTPTPVGERFDRAASALQDGEGGRALESLGNSTRGEQLQDDVQDAVAPERP